MARDSSDRPASPGAVTHGCYNPLGRSNPLTEVDPMKAVRVHTPGGPDVLKYEDVPEPQPKAGEAIVRIDAAGLNYVDVYFRSGLYKAELPMTLGLEAGGTVTAVGPHVTPGRAGAKGAPTGGAGAYPLYPAVPAQRLVV